MLIACCALGGCTPKQPDAALEDANCALTRASLDRVGDSYCGAALITPRQSKEAKVPLSPEKEEKQRSRALESMPKLQEGDANGFADRFRAGSAIPSSAASPNAPHD